MLMICEELAIRKWVQCLKTLITKHSKYVSFNVKIQACRNAFFAVYLMFSSSYLMIKPSSIVLGKYGNTTNLAGEILKVRIRVIIWYRLEMIRFIFTMFSKLKAFKLVVHSLFHIAEFCTRYCRWYYIWPNC